MNENPCLKIPRRETPVSLYRTEPTLLPKKRGELHKYLTIMQGGGNAYLKRFRGAFPCQVAYIGWNGAYEKNEKNA